MAETGPTGPEPGSRRRYIAVLTVGALGVVYGDIGTSPLYAFRASFGVADLDVTEPAILGILSLIFWALLLVVSIKYLSFVMRADNDGEGGILALTAQVLKRGTVRSRSRVALIGVGLFGTALLYGDGMITPAISVLSAVEGLELAVPALESWVVVIAAVVLVLLFANQHRGTSVLGSLFGPIMIVWFAVLAVLGVLQITEEPHVLAALSPHHAIVFAASHPRFAFLALGGVFLVVTGSEALYADMGHFGRQPIRLGWFGVVFPALVLNYFGQGALLLQDPTAIDNPFYRLAADWALVPLVILATVATVIASQALISGAYSLTAQAVQLGYLPRLRIDHTSPREFGQVYVSSVNWLLMIAAVVLVFSFRSSSNLAAAYGVGVAAILVITTVLLAVVMRERWGWRRSAIIPIVVVFLAVDLVFFAANITKISAGGWIPLAIGVLGFAVMSTWRRGRLVMAARVHQARLPIERFIESITVNPQRRVPGTGVYLFAQSGLTPPTLLTNLRHHEVIHETIVLVAVNVADRPRVPQAQRATVHVMGERFFQVDLTYGFMERPNVPLALESIVSNEFGFDSSHATFFIGKETILTPDDEHMAGWREHLFAFLHRNAASAARFFGLPPDRVVEVGIQVPL